MSLSRNHRLPLSGEMLERHAPGWSRAAPLPVCFSRIYAMPSDFTWLQNALGLHPEFGQPFHTGFLGLAEFLQRVLQIAPFLAKTVSLFLDPLDHQL